MHINIVPNRGSAPTVLLRESYREGSKVCKRTLANLSALSAAQVQMIRATLRGDVLQPIDQTFEITASPAQGLVQAVSLAMQRLGFASLLASKPCPERDSGVRDGGLAHHLPCTEARYHAAVAHQHPGY